MSTGDGQRDRITRGTLCTGDRITVFNIIHFPGHLDDNPPPRLQNAKVVSEVAIEKAPIPWGKLLLLVVILAMVVFLAVKVFAPEEESAEPSATEEVPQQEAAATPAESGLPPAESLPQAGFVAPEGGQAVAPAVQQPAVVAPSPETHQKPAMPSDVILVDSEPAGAEVYLDGKREDGLTPLLIRQLPHGRHSLELRKEGYENSMRTIMVPDMQPARPVLLRQKTGTLLCTNPPCACLEDAISW